MGQCRSRHCPVPVAPSQPALEWVPRSALSVCFLPDDEPRKDMERVRPEKRDFKLEYND